MRPLGRLAAAILAMTVGLGCGDMSKTQVVPSKPSARTSRGPHTPGGTSAKKASGDYDNDDGRQRVDNDVLSVRDYGRQATQPTGSAIAALVERYFTAAATENGAAACSMLDSGIARQAPVDYGQNGPPYMRGGRTCAAVFERLFWHFHRQLTTKASRLRVAGVRVEGDEGFVLLTFGGTSERQISVEHESDGWKVQALLDGKMRRVP